MAIIYAIEHVATGRRYIGSTIDALKRFYNHKDRLRSYVVQEQKEMASTDISL